MRHFTALLWATVAGLGLGTAGAGAPARADVPGFSVQVTVPGTFKASGNAKTLTAVATTDERRCRKVRWTLIVRGGEVPLDRIGVTRIENSREFATQVSVSGDVATITDEQVDPGTLCRGRTVTGQWQIGFGGRDGGRVRFEVRAFDAQNTLLTTSGAETEVTGQVATSSPTPSPSRTSASPEPTEEEAGEQAPAETPTPAQTTKTGAALAPASDDSNLLGPGLIVGGVFVVLGLLLLLRLRSRTREARRNAEALPTGFYTMP